MTPFFSDDWLTVYAGDCRDVLPTLAADSVDCIVTSPPYWGLRDYGTATWTGGDEGCDHSRPVRRYKDGCVGCGIPMQEQTPGCRWCADRWAKRRKNGTDPERNFNRPSENHWDKPRSRDQVTASTVPYTEVCGKCGATRQDAQLGLEATPELYVANLVAVFRELRRVLKGSGTCWLNLGDSYAAARSYQVTDTKWRDVGNTKGSEVPAGLKPKDLVGIPWRVAFALQADGWYLRSDIIWAKPNPMPESVTDRPTKAHEYLFLLTKSARYFYDADAVREAPTAQSVEWNKYRHPRNGAAPQALHGSAKDEGRIQTDPAGRNLRSVWTIATRPYPGAHFAVFPPELPERCIKAGSSERGVCPDCGAPWERQQEKGGLVSSYVGTDNPDWHEPDAKHVRVADEGESKVNGDFRQRQAVSGWKHLPRRERITTGWQPACRHYEKSWDGLPPLHPAVILDPFAGSGTVGLVANRLSRRAILIDLNPEYVTQQMRRNAQTPLGLPA